MKLEAEAAIAEAEDDLEEAELLAEIEASMSKKSKSEAGDANNFLQEHNDRKQTVAYNMERYSMYDRSNVDSRINITSTYHNLSSHGAI